MNKKGRADKLLLTAWISIGVAIVLLFLWIFGKITGIIQTPIWVSYIPHIAGGFGLLGIALQSGRIIQKVDTIENNIETMDGKA